MRDGSNEGLRPDAALGSAGSELIAFFDWADVAELFNTAPAHGFDMKEGIRSDDHGSEEWRNHAEADH